MGLLDRSRCVITCLVFVLALCARPARSQEMPVPVKMQYPLLLKILTFDRQLKVRNPDEIVIGIVYQTKFRASLNAKNELLGAASDSKLRRIESMPVRCVSIDLDNTTLKEALQDDPLSVLYIAPLRVTDMKEVAAFSRRNKVLTFTGVPDYVEAGVSVGIDTKGDRPLIIINLTSAKAEGSDFNAQFLKLAKVVQTSK